MNAFFSQFNSASEGTVGHSWSYLVEYRLYAFTQVVFLLNKIISYIFKNILKNYIAMYSSDIKKNTILNVYISTSISLNRSIFSLFSERTHHVTIN